MAGAQFKQNPPEFVKPTRHCDTDDIVGYSGQFIRVERFTFTHDSFLPTIVPKRSPTALGSHHGWPKQDTL
jgi:hypothetical protein